MPIRKPKWNTDSVHGHIRRVLPYIIQHLLLPAYVDSQRIRAVRVEPLLDGHGWVFVSRINSRKRGRERFLLGAEPAIVESGVSIAHSIHVLADDFGRTFSFHYSYRTSKHR